MPCNSCSLMQNAKGSKKAGCLIDCGCGKLDVYQWLKDMELPKDHRSCNIVEVRFKGSRKDFFLNKDDISLNAGDSVIVEGNQSGFDMGHVTIAGEMVKLQMRKKNVKSDQEFKKIIRKAGKVDLEKWQNAKQLEYETMHKARKLALELGLNMKISDVDYQGDKSKATFYYTADDRVDFRELIKRMAETFKTRIEMRQIGMRQESSRLGGIGSCGRELCCSTWFTEFKTVSTAAARYQNLSLNTLKLAGQCGKLKCCLNYELDSYMDALKDIPRGIEYIETEIGSARLQKTDIFKKIMWFSYLNADTWTPIPVDKVKEIHEMNKEGKKPTDLSEFVYNKPSALKNKILDFENVVGQDSITRLDNRNNKTKRSSSRKKKINNKNSKNLLAGKESEQKNNKQQNNNMLPKNKKIRKNNPNTK